MKTKIANFFTKINLLNLKTSNKQTNYEETAAAISKALLRKLKNVISLVLSDFYDKYT
jgi:hypothetical protein